MKTLADILKGITFTLVQGSPEQLVSAICFDSRKVSADSLFVAVRGSQTDGHSFIQSAADQGAAAIICEKAPDTIAAHITIIAVKDSARVLGECASNFYGRPSEHLKLVGVTGTNGKTTIATLLYTLASTMGYKAGLFSTVANYIDGRRVEASHTTPDPIQLNATMAEMVAAGADYCFMEVSSHAIHQQRIAGLHFDGGIFTNLTHDHLDYHGTVAEYLKAKKAFFDGLTKEAFALTNADDKSGKVMLQNTRAKTFTYSLRHLADFKGKIIEAHFDSTLLQFNQQEVWVKLIGEFNAYNLLAVYGAASLLGFENQATLNALSTLNAVDGRFDYIQSGNGTTAIVDYAHTPDALRNVLQTIRQIKGSDQEIITVTGAGGNRDKAKRPIMAAIAQELSTKLILTSDNPRNEDPMAILADMKQGLKTQRNVLVIADRAEAIRTACMLASPGAVILVAGKGHETYQEIAGVRHPFDDKAIVKEAFTNQEK